MFRSRTLFWLVALGLAAGLFWVWLRRRTEAGLPAAPASFTTLDPPNGRMAFSTTTTTPAVTPTSTPRATGAPATGPRRIVTRVHRGAPPTPVTTPPAGDSAAGVEPAESAALLMTADPAPAAPEPAPAPAEPVTLATAELEAGEVVAVAEEPATVVAEEAVAEPAAVVAEEAVAEPAAVVAEVAEEAVVEPAAEEVVTPAPAAPCNINTAGIDELAALPGISRSLARRIITRREERGPFKTIEGLIGISGIGPQKLKEFAHLITVA